MSTYFWRFYPRLLHTAQKFNKKARSRIGDRANWQDISVRQS
ncbi:hypothetical protein [Leptolyngbya sp. NIES-2104]|nr:hypothetical protein [Leptolyngbya sp. NIES-2104]GAP94861.1 hypothetical protein NIES2104_13780 [Leptolyngbya sp. NIES-2104]